MNKTIENLTDKELVDKFRRWKEVKKFGELVEKEVKARYEENGSVKGVKKVVFRASKKWKSISKLPETFLVSTPMTVSQALKAKVLTDDNMDDYVNVVNSYSYVVEE